MKEDKNEISLGGGFEEDEPEHHHGRRRDLALFRAGWRPGVNRAMNTIMED